MSAAMPYSAAISSARAAMHPAVVRQARPLGQAVSKWAVGLAERLGCDRVGGREVDGADLAFLATRQDALDVAAALARHQAEIEASDACGRGMQNGEAVPVIAHRVQLLGELACQPPDR